MLAGQNGHLLLSFTIKHIDHKSVAKMPIKQISIVKVACHLAKHAKSQASVTIASAISDLIKHLRKCMYRAIEAANGQADVDKWNSELYVALEECLVQLTEKVVVIYWHFITMTIFWFQHRCFKSFFLVLIRLGMLGLFLRWSA